VAFSDCCVVSTAVAAAAAVAAAVEVASPLLVVPSVVGLVVGDACSCVASASIVAGADGSGSSDMIRQGNRDSDSDAPMVDTI